MNFIWLWLPARGLWFAASMASMRSRQSTCEDLNARVEWRAFIALFSSMIRGGEGGIKDYCWEKSSLLLESTPTACVDSRYQGLVTFIHESLVLTYLSC